jgi:prepilin peptidase CpaA
MIGFKWSARMFDPLYARELGFPHYIVAVICLLCAVTDIRNGKIYNAITYPSIIFGIVLNSLTGDRGIIISSVGGFAFGLLPFGPAAARGWIGGGDVKLFAAIGAIAGFFFLLDCLFNCFIIAGIYIMLLFVWHKIRNGDVDGASAVFGLRNPSGTAEQRVAFRKRQIRLGVFIFLGVLLSLMRISLLGGSSS